MLHLHAGKNILTSTNLLTQSVYVYARQMWRHLHLKRGKLKMPKKNIFDFSTKNGLCHFSRLVVPYLHTKNKKNCGWAAVTDIQTYRGHLIGSSPPGGPIYRFGNLKICFKTIELFPIWPRLPYFLQQISFHECKENLFLEYLVKFWLGIWKKCIF